LTPAICSGPTSIREYVQLALDFLNIGTLRPLRSLHNLEFDHVSFLQSAIAFTNNRGIVNENVRPIVAPDEAIPFRVIEPHHCATQFRSLPKDGCISIAAVGRMPSQSRLGRYLPQSKRWIYMVGALEASIRGIRAGYVLINVASRASRALERDASLV
jgi:hypothetical protein